MKKIHCLNAISRYGTDLLTEDYELTEQDKKDMENPNFGISYGSDEVKVQEVHSMEWRTEDQAYSLVDITGTAGAEEMFSMAEEIIEGK